MSSKSPMSSKRVFTRGGKKKEQVVIQQVSEQVEPASPPKDKKEMK